MKINRILFVSIIVCCVSLLFADAFRGLRKEVRTESGIEDKVKQDVVSKDTYLPVISYPTEGQNIVVPFTIQGTCEGKPDAVEIKFESGQWQLVVGTASWTYNVAYMTPGAHSFRIRALYDETSTKDASRNFNVVSGDTTAPSVTIISGPTGNLTTNQSFTITLSVNENNGFWTTNNSTWNSFSAGNANILIDHSTTLKFYGKDIFTNTSATQTKVYVIDTIAPVVSIISGPSLSISTNESFTITLSVNKNNGYWSTNGINWKQFDLGNENIIIDHNVTLKFYGKDILNNTSITQQHSYTNRFIGAYITSWGTHGSNNGQFRSPNGILVSKDGYIYVCDTSNNRVQKFSKDGSYIARYGANGGNGTSGTNNGEFKSPIYMAQDNIGNFFVVEHYGNRVQKFSSSFNYVAQFGGLGTNSGKFSQPSGIYIDNNNNFIYVLDRGNSRVQKFNLSTSAYISEAGTYGTNAGQFTYPIDIDSSMSSNIYISDTPNNKIQIYNSIPNYVTNFGSTGSGNGQFNYITGIKCDKFDCIWVCDGNNNRIQEITTSGQFIMTFGTLGFGSGQFNFPTDIEIDNKGYFYFVDRNNNRIQKFR